MAAIENPLSTVQFEPHDGGIGPQLANIVLQGDVEAALAAFKGSAVSDRDMQTVELMELISAKITEVRPVV
jgi:hypothetical protein